MRFYPFYNFYQHCRWRYLSGIVAYILIFTV